MNIRELNDDWLDEWDAFCINSSDAWFWHTSNWLSYNQEYAPRLEPVHRSFMITRSKEILAICPLLSIETDGVVELDFPSGFGIAPAVSDSISQSEEETVKSKIFSHIDAIADHLGAKRVRLRIPPLSQKHLESYPMSNWLLEHRFLNLSMNTRIVDLSIGTDEIWAAIRRSYRQDIERATESLEVDIYDARTVTRAIVERYREMHIQAAGQQPRPDSTYEFQFDWIDEGNAFLAIATSNGAYVGVSYFITYKGNVFYFSSARDDQLDGVAVGHHIQWEAMKYMMEQGYRFYELGRQRFETTIPEFPQKKVVNIDFFKRGFGGSDYPLFRGEKYYSNTYFQKQWEEYGELGPDWESL